MIFTEHYRRSKLGEIERRMARWLRDAELTSGPRHAPATLLGSIGLTSTVQRTCVRELDGSPAARCFTALSRVDASRFEHTSLQRLCVHTFSIARAWIQMQPHQAAESSSRASASVELRDALVEHCLHLLT